jgi:hypothetical protein
MVIVNTIDSIITNSVPKKYNDHREIKNTEINLLEKTRYWR